jgi:hypothetical protein
MANTRRTLAALIVLAAFVAPGAADGDAIHRCATVTGAHWSYQGQSGTRYRVSELRPGGGDSLCSLAQRQVPRLSRMRNGSAPIRLGSMTFVCTRHRPVGDCIAERDAFRWSPAT